MLQQRLNNKPVKQKWVPMEIYRVPLNPEQAVLSCCDSAGRGQVAELQGACTLHLGTGEVWLEVACGMGTSLVSS